MYRHTILSILTVIILSFLSYVFFFYIDSIEETVVVEIHRGSGLMEIARQLEDHDVVRSRYLFIVSVILKRAHGELKAGEYEFMQGESLSIVTGKIISGKVKLRKVTVPEGKNIYEISEILTESQITQGENFLDLVKDADIVRSITGTNAPNLEGYLFPDTYYFPKGTSAERVISTMTERFFSVKNAISNGSTSWLSDHDIVILASMIEKETGYDSERQLVSSVFHNRLEKRMRLECDPTVIYGFGPDFDRKLTRKDLRSDHEYNTYTRHGLPAGPIGNPGRKSLEAAMNPAESQYLFFVSRGDGTHVFSRNYREHQDAVNRYIRGN